MIELKDVLIAGLPLIVITLGIVEASKQFGISGKGLLAESLIVGTLYYAAYYLGTLYAWLHPWLELVTFGLGGGLATSGIYDLIQETAAPRASQWNRSPSTYRDKLPLVGVFLMFVVFVWRRSKALSKSVTPRSRKCLPLSSIRVKALTDMVARLASRFHGARPPETRSWPWGRLAHRQIKRASRASDKLTAKQEAFVEAYSAMQERRSCCA